MTPLPPPHFMPPPPMAPLTLPAAGYHRTGGGGCVEHVLWQHERGEEDGRSYPLLHAIIGHLGLQRREPFVGGHREQRQIPGDLWHGRSRPRPDALPLRPQHDPADRGAGSHPHRPRGSRGLPAPDGTRPLRVHVHVHVHVAFACGICMCMCTSHVACGMRKVAADATNPLHTHTHLPSSFITCPPPHLPSAPHTLVAAPSPPFLSPTLPLANSSSVVPRQPG